MKILFYLPAVTPWWFDRIISPMLRGLHGDAELHIIVAPKWNNLGIEEEHALALDDLDRLNWHIVTADEPAQFIGNGLAVPGLLDLVRQIDPDVTLARSADIDIADQFPGIVRFLMEGTAPPFEAPFGWVALDERPIEHGFVPSQSEELADQCADALDDTWKIFENKLLAPLETDWRERLGLPSDRPILAVPLQYEHSENIFQSISPFQNGSVLIENLLDHLDEDVFIAFTDHPLNQLHMLRFDLTRLERRFAGRVLHCVGEDLPRGATGLLAAGADAILIDQSKCITQAMFLGCPVVRTGMSRMADWIRPNSLADVVPGRLANRGLKAPDRASARRWFGYHYGIRTMEPMGLTVDRLLGHVSGKPDLAALSATMDVVVERQKKFI